MLKQVQAWVQAVHVLATILCFFVSIKYCSSLQYDRPNYKDMQASHGPFANRLVAS